MHHKSRRIGQKRDATRHLRSLSGCCSAINADPVHESNLTRRWPSNERTCRGATTESKKQPSIDETGKSHLSRSTADLARKRTPADDAGAGDFDVFTMEQDRRRKKGKGVGSSRIYTKKADRLLKNIHAFPSPPSSSQESYIISEAGYDDGRTSSGFRVPPKIDLQPPATSCSSTPNLQSPMDTLPEPKFNMPPDLHSSSNMTDSKSEITSSSSASPSPILQTCAPRNALLSPDTRSQSQTPFSYPARCPICQVPVSDSLLEKHTSGASRLRVRDQLLFCRTHRCLDAAAEYSARGYPTINWATLPVRLETHISVLIAHLNGSPSFWRRRLAEKIACGKGRNMIQGFFGEGLESLTPGYFGARGRELMTSTILAHLSPTLRRLATGDRLIASGGVSGYVQAVLVPELATRLIMEDMGVDEEKAREVLQESIGIADVLDDGHGLVTLKKENGGKLKIKEKKELTDDDDDDDEEEKRTGVIMGKSRWHIKEVIDIT